MKIDDIKDPTELIDIKEKDFKELSNSIRKELISLSKIKKIHLSSNLGVVEITIMLMKHFSSTKNKIFFDTGHQSYVHKMLTKRFDKINTIKDYKGLSGFQSNKESKYDFFSSGHSGNSLSIVQGYIESTINKNKIITVIGDAAISNGLSFEALNSIGFKKNKMLIILNDNGMSISKNVGSLSVSLKRMKYNNFFFNFIKNSKNQKKINLFNLVENKLNKKNFFHNMGFYYIGRVNGHNFKSLDKAIKKGKFYSNFFPTIIHVKTTKGKGINDKTSYDPKYHSFKFEENDLNLKKTFSEISADYLYNRISKSKNIKIINSAMTYSSGFEKIEHKFPNNYEDVGINEEHSISKSAGIELANKRAVIIMYSTFLQRTYDQILNDVSREKLPVLFLIDRSDLSYGDGDTHHGIYDVGMIKSIPNTIISMPSTKNELEQLINMGLNNKKDSFFIRITNEYSPKNNDIKISLGDWNYILKNTNSQTCIISYGIWINKIYEEYNNQNIDILNAIFIKGFNEKCVLKKINKYKKIIFYERIYKEGSLYKDILCLINKNNLKIKCYVIAFERNDIGFGEKYELNKINNMDILQIKKYL